MVQRFDYLVIGSGIAGMSFALKVANEGKSVALICKAGQEEANTYFAQGGIASVTNLKVDNFVSAGSCSTIRRRPQPATCCAVGCCPESREARQDHIRVLRPYGRIRGRSLRRHESPASPFAAVFPVP